MKAVAEEFPAAARRRLAEDELEEERRDEGVLEPLADVGGDLDKERGEAGAGGSGSEARAAAREARLDAGQSLTPGPQGSGARQSPVAAGRSVRKAGSGGAGARPQLHGELFHPAPMACVSGG